MPKAWGISSCQNKVLTSVPSFWWSGLGSTPCFLEALVAAGVPWQVVMSLQLWLCVASTLFFSVCQVCLSPLIRTVLPRSISLTSLAKDSKSIFPVLWYYELVSLGDSSSVSYSLGSVSSCHISMERWGEFITRQWRHGATAAKRFKSL